MTQQKLLFSWHKINFLHLFLFIIYRHEILLVYIYNKYRDTETNKDQKNIM